MWPRIGLVAVVSSLSALPALACSCGGGNPNSCQVPQSDITVRATVVSIDRGQPRVPFIRPAPGLNRQPADRLAGAVPQPEPWGSVKVTLAISERFRGEAGDFLVVRTELNSEACGYPFEVGHEYLVFANQEAGRVTVTSCSATQPAKMAAARIEQLRALRDGTPLPDIYGFVGTHPIRWGEESQAIPGLTVTARAGTAEYQVQTDENGLYGFRGLPVGRYQLSVAAPPGRKAFWGAGAENPGASPGVPCAMNFEVFWDGRMSGTVLDSDGRPASGSIGAFYTGPETVNPSSFGAEVKEGRFEILRLPPGRYRLMFSPFAAGRPTGRPVYYPGTLARDAAVLIDVGEGTHVENLVISSPAEAGPR